MKKQLGKQLLCIALSLQMLLSLGMTGWAAEVPIPADDMPITDLTSLTPTDFANGDGSGKNMKFDGKNAGNKQITLYDGAEAVIYEKGIGMQAPGWVEYDISGIDCNVFRAKAGVDFNNSGDIAADDPGKGSCKFLVWVDGVKVYESGEVMYRLNQAEEVEVLLPSTAKTLKLQSTDGGNGKACDWANWAAPVLAKDTTLPDDFTSLTAQADRDTVEIGETAQIMAAGIRLSGAPIDHIMDYCTFISGNPAVAAVDENGLVTAVSQGKATITVTAEFEGITRTASAIVTVTPAALNVWTVKSPSEKLRFTLTEMAGGQCRYSVSSDGTKVIETSLLGLNTSLGSFTDGLTFLERTDLEIDETYPMLSGKKSVYTNHCNESTFSFTRGGVDDVTFQIIVRAYDDGIAYRYGLVSKNPGDAFTISSERSTFQVPVNSVTTMMEYDSDAKKVGKCYEDAYTMGDISETNGKTYNMPFLYQTQDIYVLVTEAALSTEYCGSVLKGGTDGLMNVAFAPTQGAAAVSTTAPWVSPWRAAVIGGAKEIVENTLPENLSPACVMEDTSWIEPATTSWTWYVAGKAGQSNPEFIKEYIDVAAEFGWKYFLMDEGWQAELVEKDPGKWPDGPDNFHKWLGIPDWMEEIVAYGKAKGVGIMAWVDSKDLDGPNEQKFIKELHDIGIVGMKIDFFNSESQKTMKLYDTLYQLCAENEMMLDIHGCNKPTGEIRTYPNLLTREAIRAQEYNSTKADLNTMYVFTRTAIGPADYNPAVDLMPNGDVTAAHKIALNVLYETGLPCPSDKGSTYKRLPVFSLMKDLPAKWDDICYIDGAPGDFATLARRSGDNWYVASICTGAREAVIPLDFLDEGVYYAHIYKDGASQWDMDLDIQKVTGADTLRIPMSKGGGCTVMLTVGEPAYPLPESMSLDAAEASVRDDSTLRLTPVFDPVDSRYITKVEWSSSNEEIAIVDVDGVVAGQKLGTAIITAKATAPMLDEPLYAACAVTVTPGAYRMASPWKRRNPTAAFRINNENSITQYPCKGQPEVGAGTKNELIFTPPDEDFVITVTCDYTPESNYQSAGVVVKGSNGWYLGSIRRFHGGFGGNIFEAIKLSGNGWNEPRLKDASPSQTSYLKIEKTGTLFKRYYSLDNENWTLIDTQTNVPDRDAAANPDGGGRIVKLPEDQTWSIMLAAWTGTTAADSRDPATFSDFTYNGELMPLAAPYGDAFQVTEIGALDDLTVNVGTQPKELDLPRTVEVTLDGGDKTDMQVIWDMSSYDSTSGGTYTLPGTLRMTEGIENDAALKASIKVTVVGDNPSYNPGGSNSSTKTVKNPDGSTTKTVIDAKTGTVTETTTYPDGTKIVAATPKGGEASIEVTVPRAENSVTITIPTEEKPAPGEVAVAVGEDGTRRVIKTSVAAAWGMRVTLTESCKLEIVDYAKRFADVPDGHWAGEAITFVSSRELFSGTGKETFTPGGDMTLGMLTTVLARLNGQGTTGGDTWYAKGMDWAKEQGISDGTAPEAAMTREQLAVMLYRCAGSAETGDMVLAEFEDAADVSGWAVEAMTWAVQAGIIKGSGHKLNPGAAATRAEVAAMLQRFISR